MIIAVCDPKGIAIEAIKTILYHDKGLSDRISRIYEFWNMEQLLDASRDIRCLIAPAFVWFSDILIGLPDNLIQAIAAVWLVVMSIFVPAVVERTIDGF